MDGKIFKARTKKLAVAMIKQVDKLPHSLGTVASIKTLCNRKS